MATYSVTPGSGVILLSTHWDQSGKIELADGTYSNITYNEYCPLDSNTGTKSVTGCTNTAAAQILYYWIQRGLLKLSLTLTAEDSYNFSSSGKIDETAGTAAANGYLAFSEVNSHLSQFTVDDAEDIAVLSFACGVVQKAYYGSSMTTTPWDSDLFYRAGMAGCSFISSGSSNSYFFDSSDDNSHISDAGYEILINELLAGRPVGASSFTLGHAVVFDGYNAGNETFHINYGWGSGGNWYTKEEIEENKYGQFLLDLYPSYDGSPILVTSSASYGVGTFLRGMEQLQGIAAADTLTVQTGIAGSHVEMQRAFNIDKAITLNNLNSELIFSQTCYIINSTENITFNGFSGVLSNQYNTYGVYAVKTAKNLTINNCSGLVSVSGDYSTAFSAQNITVNGMNGLFSVASASSSANVLHAEDSLEVRNVTGNIIAVNTSSYSQYTLKGNSVNLQNFSGICISSDSTTYTSYAISSSAGMLNMGLNNGKIYAGKKISQDVISAMQEDLSSVGAAGVAAAVKYNENAGSSFFSVGGSNQDDIIILKNYSTLQGNIALESGNDTLAVFGGSYVYAPSVRNVENITIDSTSTIYGTFTCSAASAMTVNMIITAETPAAEMIHLQKFISTFNYYLKNKTLNVDLRGAKDGEYVLVNAAGLSSASSLATLSAEINTGSSTFTLKCGESANHVTLKYENGKLILALEDFAAQATGALLFEGDILKSVSESVRSQTISGEENDSLRLTNGGTAENITVAEGGTLSVSNNGTVTGTVVNAYGFLAVNEGGKAVNTTVNANGTLNLATAGTLAGSLTINDNATVKAASNSIFNFSLNGCTESTYQGINDLSRIAGTPQYMLTVSSTQSSGKYILAGNAADFASTITVTGLAQNYSLNLGSSKSFEAAGKKYTLSLNSDEELVLFISGNTEDIEPPFILLEGDNKTFLRSAELTATVNETAEIYYSTDKQNWILYTAALLVIANGTYYFKATDAAGNTGYAQKTFANIDRSAPAVPQKISITENGGSAVLSWEESIDTGGAGTAGYEISYRYGTNSWKSVTSAQPKAVLENLTPGEYQLKIRSYDVAGNYSEYSENQSFHIAGGHERIVNTDAVLTVEDSAYFAELSSVSSGGAIKNGAAGIITIGKAAQFVSNKAEYDGGAIYNKGEIRIKDGAAFSQNSARFGGAVFNHDSTGVIGANAVFAENSAKYGGAVYNAASYDCDGNPYESTLTIGENAVFSKNSATDFGGAVYAYDGTFTVGASAQFIGNSAKNGGAIGIGGTLENMTIGDSALFEENTATEYGGAIYLFNSATITLSSAVFRNNTAKYAGAIYNMGTVTLCNARFETASDTIVNYMNMTFSGTISLAAYLYTSTTITATGANIVFDLSPYSSANEVTCLINNLSMISGAANYSITVNDNQAAGAYWLARGAGAFNKTISIQNSSGTTLVDSLAVGGSKTVGNKKYSLSLQYSDLLIFNIEECETAPVITITADNQTPARSVTLSATTDVAATLYYSTDNANWLQYTSAITVAANGTYYFKAIDLAGNTGYAQQTFRNIITVPYNLQADQSGVEWSSVPDTSLYQIEYSQDNFTHCIAFKTAETGVDTFALPQGNYSWRVKADNGEWVSGSTITADDYTTAQNLVSTANGFCDLFFANASGTWDSSCLAQHCGYGSWTGTGEYVELEGKNIIADFFTGSSDANILLLTDSDNGDALFVDDIYTALPGTVAEQHSRLSQIKEIRGGAGADVIDLTSQRFSYTGSGMTILGGEGDDVIWANQGDNKLFGDAGNDRIIGGIGNDVIVGGSGDDALHGGGGNDLFTFCGNWGKDRVEQLAEGTVTLWFDSHSGSWDQSTLTYRDGENSVTITGVSTVELKFGDDNSAEYDTLCSAGAFAESTSFSL